MIFIDNKKLILAFVWPSIKVLFIKAHFFNRSLVVVCWEGQSFILADSDRFVRLVMVWRRASGFVQTMQDAATLELIMSQLLSKLQQEATDDLFIWIKSESTCDYNIHWLHSEKIKSIELMAS